MRGEEQGSSSTMARWGSSIRGEEEGQRSRRRNGGRMLADIISPYFNSGLKSLSLSVCRNEWENRTFTKVTFTFISNPKLFSDALIPYTLNTFHISDVFHIFFFFDIICVPMCLRWLHGGLKQTM